jgi:transposase-like protein
MVALARSGRTAASLSKEFGPSAMTIGTWIQQAARDAGKGDGGLSSAEREELTRLRRENRRLKEEREILSKAAAWFATESGPSKRSLGFVKVNQAIHAVGLMCRLLEVSRSGFYAWVDRPMCTRRRWDLELTGNICSTHRRSRETYGAPNIHAELADDHGIRVGRKRVARLMRRNGI